MSWESPSKKGGLKGGFRLLAEENPSETLPSSSDPINKKRRFNSIDQKDPSNLFVGDAITESAPSNSPSCKDYIKLSLDQQFKHIASSLEKTAGDALNDIVTNVQRVLSDRIEFVTGKSQHNALLLQIQRNFSDVSKIRVKSPVQFHIGNRPLKKVGMLTCVDAAVHRSHDEQFKAPLRNGSSNGQSTRSPPTPAKGSEIVEEQLPEPKLVFFDEKNIRLDWPKMECVGAGLHNMGNTCFLNATLQCLAYTPALQNYLMTENHAKNCRHQGYCINCKLQDLLYQMLRSRNSSLRPSAIYLNIRVFAKTLSMGRQEDAHEFLRFLIEAMRKTALTATGKDVKTLDLFTQETTFVSRIFGGFYRSRVLCLNCKHSSNVYDPFMDIPLDIARVATLEEALKTFTRVEHLNSPNNLYHCERCKKSCQATKQVTVHKPPAILTFQLKRFLFNSFASFSKIDKPVQFPESFDLRPYMSVGEGSGPVKYKLYAVLVHSGSSCHSGHYFSFVKSPGNTWNRMDDTQVSPAGLQAVLNQRAYLVFYTRDQSVSLPLSAKGFAPGTPKPVIYGPQQSNQSAGSKPSDLFFQNSQQKVGGSTLPGIRLPVLPPASRNESGAAPVNGNSIPSSNGAKPIAFSYIPRAIAVNNRFTGKLNITQQTPLQTSLPGNNGILSLVPYADDEEETDQTAPHPEPTSRGSSTSSTDSVKENKETVSRKRSPSAASEDTTAKILKTSAAVGSMSLTFSEKEEKKLPSVLSSGTDLPSAVNETVEDPVSAAHVLSKKALKKLSKKKLPAEENFGIQPTEEKPSTAETTSPRKLKKKKKKSKHKRDDNGADLSLVQTPLWVEKDIPSMSMSSIAVPDASSVHFAEGLTSNSQREPSLLVPLTSQNRSDSPRKILSWSGGKSLLDEDAEARSLESRKRSFEEADSYDGQFDEGKGKKFKSKHALFGGYRNGGGNAFQSYQNNRTKWDSRSKSAAPSKSHGNRDFGHRSRSP